MTLPFGKYRGRDVSDVPASYLAWLLEEATDLRANLRRAIAAELAERLELELDEAEPQYVAVAARPPVDLLPALRDIVHAGYRQSALRAHPDHGGETARMQRLNAARDWLASTCGVRA